MLALVGLLACFLGRVHIFVFSFLINCFRSPLDDPPPIDGPSQFVMWASGLRGGVAFAIASKSFHHLDFGERCGGLTRDAADATETCADVNDGAAVLQITMIIVLFTIFVFG
eukprot:4799849-Prymnesium_polylepis.1